MVEHIENQAPAFFLDHFHRQVKLITAVTAQRTKGVAGQTLRVSPDQHRFVPGDVTLDESHMVIAVNNVFKNSQTKMAIASGEISLSNFFDQCFSAHPVADKISNG